MGTKKRRRGRRRPARNDAGRAYQVEGGDGSVVFESSAEATEYVFTHMFPDPPPGAQYRDQEIPLQRGGSLTIIEEVAPGDDPDGRRRVYIEAAGNGQSEATPVPYERDDLTQIKYDVAVTFAGEQRAYVEQVVERLSDQGVVVFYDKKAKAQLWGRDLLDELVETYRSRAFRVLMFASKEYAAKAWPTQERRAALERAMDRFDEPYILLVRFDDVPVPGLPGTTFYQDARELTAVELADLTVEHLRDSGRDVGPPPSQRDAAERVSVRAVPGRRADGRWQLPYDIYNGADYPITNVVLVIDDPDSEGTPEDQMGTAMEIVIGTVAARETISDRTDHLHFSRDPHFGELTQLGVLLFTDHWGNHWATRGAAVTRRKSPPRVC